MNVEADNKRERIIIAPRIILGGDERAVTS